MADDSTKKDVNENTENIEIREELEEELLLIKVNIRKAMVFLLLVEQKILEIIII